MVTRWLAPLARRVGGAPGEVWPWLLSGGIVLIVLGCLALAFLTLEAYASTLAFGLLLLVGGLVQLFEAARARAKPGLSHYLLVGVVAVFAGVAIAARPGYGALAASLLLAGFYMSQGACRVVVASLEELPGRPWALACGVITFLLGVLVGAQWPADPLWAIGVVVGVDLLVTGVTHVLGALELHQLGRAAPGIPAAGASP